jgi:hypothetical protein
MKYVLAVAGLVLVISLAGCASTQEQHVVSQDGVPIYCTSGIDQDEGDCDSDEVAAIKSAPVWYKVESNIERPPPYDPGPIPNFGR